MAKVMGLITANYKDNLASITENRSLASLPFGGRYRLIDFALSNMTNSGIKTVSLITPASYRSIIDHVSSGKHWSLDRKEGGLLILPGSVMGMKKSENGKFIMRDLIQNKIALERSNVDLILMMSSDKVMNFNFKDIIKEHEESKRDITMFYKTTDNSDNSGHYLTIEKDGKVTNISNTSSSKANKFMDCFIMGRKAMLELINWYLAMEHSDLIDIISENINNYDIRAFELTNYVGTIESISDYINSNRDLFKEEVSDELFNGSEKIYTKVIDNPPSRFKESANVTNSIIPSGCEIEGTVENSILFRGVKVRKGAVVKNCILLQRCEIEENVVLDEVICDKGVVISNGTRLFGAEGRPCVMTKSMH